MNKNSFINDAILTALVVAIIAILIIPLPPPLLDVLIIFNLMIAVIILMVSLYLTRPLEFASYPTLLLIVTVFRLSINVATSRSILLHAEAGKVVETFAQFVIGGNYVVGVIIFIILIIIQFLVVTEGAKRVAEVAARFTLDAMPGKQMSIDADLASGLIDAEGARARRKDLERESGFFGTMDGANKFVKGDVIASIILVVVNVIAGFLIGMLMLGMEPAQAIARYTMLSIGDGISSIVPSMLISISAGLVSTRASSDFNLATDLRAQLFTSPRALGATGTVMAMLGLIPGMPLLLFLGIGGTLGLAAFLQLRRQLAPPEAAADFGMPDGDEDYVPESDEDLKNPENVMKMLGVPPLTLELGLDLVPLVDPGLGGELMDRVVPMRVSIALDLGFVMPGIQFKDNLNLRPNTYQILVKGSVVASGELLVGYMLAIQQASTDANQELVGFPTTDPAFGKPAVWVAGAEAQRAAQLGYLIQDPTNVLTAHLEEVVRSHSFEILSREEVQLMLNRLREKAPITVKELIPDVLGLGEVQRVLQNLIRERVSIRDLATILEKLADYGKMTKDPFLLTELTRQSVARQICSSVADEEKLIAVITLDAGVEQAIQQAITSGPQGSSLALNPQISQLVLARLASEHQQAVSKGINPALLCNPVIRPYVKNLIERNFPQLVVISYNEISKEFKIQSVGTVSIAVGAIS